MNSDFEDLKLDRVTRRFAGAGGAAFNALSELTMTIKRGEFIALLGPSGCGKSTALNCIAGLLPLSDGTIMLDDTRIDTLPPEQRGFGMVFQNYALFPHMTVEKNVGFGLRMRGVAGGRNGDARRQGAEDGAAHRPGAQAARAAVRRPAAARRHRPRDRHRAAADPDGRAAVESRCEAAHRDPRRDPAHPHRARPRDDLRHARPGRGAVARRPHRRHEGRRRPADRLARGGLSAAGQPARRALHGLPQRARARRRRARRAIASRCPAPTSASPARRSCRSPADAAASRFARRRRCSPTPARRQRDRRRSRPTSNTAAAIRWSTSARRRERCSTSAPRARRASATPCTCRFRSTARSSIRCNSHGDRRRAARARALRPKPAAGRAGGRCSCCCSSSIRSSTGCGCRSRPRRAARWPTTRTSSPPTTCGRRSGRRCKLALPATLINVGLALPIAFKMRVKTPYQRFVTTILVVPITLGTVLIAEGMLIYFGPKGWLAQFLQFFHLYDGAIRLTHNYTGVLISLVVSGFPFAFLLILSYITGIDPGLARAAATLGADPKAQFRHIYLPLLAPGLAMCFCLAFVQAFSVFPSAVLLGSPAGPTRVISIAAYEAAFEVYDYSLASAIAMIMGAVQLVIVVAVLGLRNLFYRGPVVGGKGIAIGQVPRPGVARPAARADDAVRRQHRPHDRRGRDELVRAALARHLASRGLDHDVVHRRVEGIPAGLGALGDRRGRARRRAAVAADRRAGGVHARAAQFPGQARADAPVPAAADGAADHVRHPARDRALQGPARRHDLRRDPRQPDSGGAVRDPGHDAVHRADRSRTSNRRRACSAPAPGASSGTCWCRCSPPASSPRRCSCWCARSRCSSSRSSRPAPIRRRSSSRSTTPYSRPACARRSRSTRWR